VCVCVCVCMCVCVCDVKRGLQKKKTIIATRLYNTSMFLHYQQAISDY